MQRGQAAPSATPLLGVEGAVDSLSMVQVRNKWGRAARVGLVCWALGLMTTVAVAWLIAAFVKLERRSPYAEWKNEFGNLTFGGYDCRGIGAERVRWGLNVYMFDGPVTIVQSPTGEWMTLVGEEGKRMRSMGAEVLPQFQADGRFPHWWGALPSMKRDVPSDQSPRVIQDARGWPVLALWCEWQEGTTFAKLAPVSGGIDLQMRGSGSDETYARALPLRPIWRGLIVDTLVFCAAWYGVLFAAGSVRRFRRGRRGQCLGCGYDLRGLDGGRCPECGVG